MTKINRSPDAGRISIPPAALEAGIKAFAEAEENVYTTRAEDLRAAFEALVAAWPGMQNWPDPHGRLILPLTENPDDKA